LCAGEVVARVWRSADIEQQNLCVSASTALNVTDGELRIVFGNKTEAHSFCFQNNVTFVVFDSYQEK
jgi:hypothetical protein